jgi:4,5-DOPA dioxygenase extradiol
MPVLFVAHGAPMLLDDAQWMRELLNWGQSLPSPKSILVISAHWECKVATLGATTPVPLVYDFYGFPQRFYETMYPAPGAPELALRVRALLASNGLGYADAPERGLDHGAYIPLVAMYPDAAVPVLQLSLPALHEVQLVRLGSALPSLRDEGVLILASGFLTHNMRFAFQSGTPAWAREFDTWVKSKLDARELTALTKFREAPHASIALPTWEHFAPLLVAVGAAPRAVQISYPIDGFWMNGAFSRRSVQFDD